MALLITVMTIAIARVKKASQHDVTILSAGSPLQNALSAQVCFLSMYTKQQGPAELFGRPSVLHGRRPKQFHKDERAEDNEAESKVIWGSKTEGSHRY
jgi:hypothetical protein